MEQSKVSVTVGDGPKLSVGDLFTLDTVEFRKWWQFWKPKWRAATKTYKVTAEKSSQGFHFDEA